MQRAWVGWLFAIISCAPRVDPRTPLDADDPRAAAPVSSSAPTAAAAPPAIVVMARTRTGVVERARLVRVLDQGPARLLAGIEVAAEVPGGKFVGWRLVRLLSGGSVLEGVDLIPGDVLVAVNQRALSRPDDLAKLWNELYTAEVIEAEVRRDGAPVMLRFEVMPSATAAEGEDGAAATAGSGKTEAR